MTNRAASKLAKRRWAGVSKADRSKAASHAATQQWAQLSDAERQARIAKMVAARKK